MKGEGKRADYVECTPSELPEDAACVSKADAERILKWQGQVWKVYWPAVSTDEAGTFDVVSYPVQNMMFAYDGGFFCSRQDHDALLTLKRTTPSEELYDDDHVESDDVPF